VARVREDRRIGQPGVEQFDNVGARASVGSNFAAGPENVKGSDFIQLHELFDSLAGTVQGFVDLVAERATTTIRIAAAASSLDEYARRLRRHGRRQCPGYGVRHLRARVRAAADAAGAARDMNTNDLFVEVSRGIDKGLWFLEAHPQKAR
jgi:starvation-inducible DNA-binding protein